MTTKVTFEMRNGTRFATFYEQMNKTELQDYTRRAVGAVRACGVGMTYEIEEVA